MTREEVAKVTGLRLDIVDDLYERAAGYARHKAMRCGKDGAYIELLIPDVLREMAYSRMTIRLMEERDG